MANQKPGLNMTTLENRLCEAACKIRGEVDAPKYKDYILPLIFLKRLSDVFEEKYRSLPTAMGIPTWQNNLSKRTMEWLGCIYQ